MGRTMFLTGSVWVLLLLGTVHASTPVACEYFNKTNGIVLFEMAPYVGTEPWTLPGWECNNETFIEAVTDRIQWLRLFELMADSFVYNDTSPYDCLYQVQLHLQLAGKDTFPPTMLWQGSSMYAPPNFDKDCFYKHGQTYPECILAKLSECITDVSSVLQYCMLLL